MNSSFRFVVLVAALCFSAQLRAQLIGNIAFLPARPTTMDSVSAIFTPAAGQPDYCAFFVDVKGTDVFIVSYATFSTSCGNNQAIDTANLGQLPAGTYQVTWGFYDNFFGALFPTERLEVAAVPARVPTLSASGMLLLGCFILSVVLWHNPWSRMRPNYSFKRTAATGCGTISRRSAAAA